MTVSSNRTDHSNRSMRSTFSQSYHDLNDLYKKPIASFSEIVKMNLTDRTLKTPLNEIKSAFLKYIK